MNSKTCKEIRMPTILVLLIVLFVWEVPAWFAYIKYGFRDGEQAFACLVLDGYLTVIIAIGLSARLFMSSENLEKFWRIGYRVFLLTLIPVTIIFVRYMFILVNRWLG